MFEKIDNAYVDDFRLQYNIVAEDCENDADKTLGEIDYIRGEIQWNPQTTEEEIYNKEVKAALNRFYEFHLFPVTRPDETIKELQYHLNMSCGDEITANIYTSSIYGDVELACVIYVECHRLLEKKYLVIGARDTDDIKTFNMENTDMLEIINWFLAYTKEKAETEYISITIID